MGKGRENDSKQGGREGGREGERQQAGTHLDGALQPPCLYVPDAHSPVLPSADNS